MVDVIAEASHSLGPKHEFTLQMRWELTAEAARRAGDSDAWKSLFRQFEKELGCNHQMTLKARRMAWPPPPPKPWQSGSIP